LYDPLAPLEALGVRLPRVPLGQWPTPVMALPELGLAIGSPQLAVKRDDRSASLYGGNKVRKLELLFADAIERGHTEVFTAGPLGSNHVLATALFARELGLGCRALLFPRPPTPEVIRQTQWMALAGARITSVPTPRRLRRALLGTSADRGAPYPIPVGGSTPLGTVGFVAAAFELRAQVERGELDEPRRIWVALGTGGTAAGLALGCKLAGLRSRVVAVRVTSPWLVGPRTVRRQMHDAMSLLRRLGYRGPSPVLRARDVDVIGDQLGAGYGAPTPAGAAAKRLFSELGGLALDDTYTAKTAAALIAARRGDTAIGTDLFWHTKSSAPPPFPPEQAERARLPLSVSWLLSGGLS
jgi:D-cysteine desulfhydrase